MSTDALRVPAEHGEVLAVPRLAEYLEWMERNRAEASAWTFEICSQVSAERWRGTARSKLYHAACDALQPRRVPGLPSHERPVVLGGHQPELLSPGPWVKSFILDAMAHRGSLPIELLVDSDLPGARGVVLPTRRAGRFRLAVVDIPGMLPGRPWEGQPPLARHTWMCFLDGVAEALQALPSDEPLQRLGRFRAVLGEAGWVAEAQSLGESLAGARRAWEANVGYVTLPVSSLSDSLPFRLFVGGVIERLEEFHAAHNGALLEHRLSRGIRSTANPFPDLRRRDDLWETPFWFLHEDGLRRGLFARRVGAAWQLASGDLELARVHGARDVVDWASRLPLTVGIRPRALTLTMYARLASDLFLHGVGGAHYDRVTDAVIERFHGVRGPRFAVASATLFPDLGLDPGRGGADMDTRAARAVLRDLFWNPQRHGGDPDLAERKAALIAELLEAPPGRRAQLTREIRAVNEGMARALEPERERLERRVRQAEAEDADLAVLRRRTYPCFLFDPDDMRALVNKM